MPLNSGPGKEVDFSLRLRDSKGRLPRRNPCEAGEDGPQREHEPLSAPLAGPTRLVGILNLTPDSFSDGGQWSDPKKAAERAVQMAEEGAALIDIGGQSTRPGHLEVT